jgi:hypothetical protein
MGEDSSMGQEQENVRETLSVESIAGTSLISCCGDEVPPFSDMVSLGTVSHCMSASLL